MRFVFFWRRRYVDGRDPLWLSTLMMARQRASCLCVLVCLHATIPEGLMVGPKGYLCALVIALVLTTAMLLREMGGSA